VTGTSRSEFGKERADRYEVAIRRAPEARAAEVAVLLETLKGLHIGGCRGMIDLGAGHGYLTAAILDFLAPDGIVFAVDTSPEMAQRIPRHHQIRPLVAPLDRLDIASGTIEAVVSLAAFHHVTNKTLVLRELNRLLIDGGYVLIADVNEGTPTQEFFDHVVRDYCATGHDLDFLDRAWAAVIAARAGMRHVASSVERTDWRFDDEETMLTYVANLFSLEVDTARLRPLVERWMPPYKSPDGAAILLPWWLGFHVFRNGERG
jgi:SAM-dependent methyltransferase